MSERREVQGGMAENSKQQRKQLSAHASQTLAAVLLWLCAEGLSAQTHRAFQPTESDSMHGRTGLYQNPKAEIRANTA